MYICVCVHIHTYTHTLYNVIHDDCLNIPGYTILRFDRPAKGGGVMLLISSNYTVINFKIMFVSWSYSSFIV